MVDQFLVAVPVDLVGPFEGPFAPVARGQESSRVHPFHQAGGPEGREADIGRMGFDPGVVPPCDFGNLLRHGGGHLLRPSRHHGLEIFRSHDGAHAGAAVEVFHIVHDVGEPDEPLSGLADGSHADALVPEFFLEPQEGLPIVQTPYGPCIPQFDLAVVDVEVGRLGGLPAKDDGIEAREFHLRPEVSARFGFAESPRERRLRGRREAVESRQGHAGDHTGGEHQHVFRPQRVDPRLQELQEIIARESRAAHVGPVPGFARFLDLPASLGEIHVKYFAVVSKSHETHSLFFIRR